MLDGLADFVLLALFRMSSDSRIIRKAFLPGSVVAGASFEVPQSMPVAGERIHVRQQLVAEHGAA